MQVAEWTRNISFKWRELTAEQKETFQKMAANDKQRYVQQVDRLKCTCGFYEQQQYVVDISVVQRVFTCTFVP